MCEQELVVVRCGAHDVPWLGSVPLAPQRTRVGPVLRHRGCVCTHDARSAVTISYKEERGDIATTIERLRGTSANGLRSCGVLLGSNSGAVVEAHRDWTKGCRLTRKKRMGREPFKPEVAQVHVSLENGSDLGG